MVSLVAEIPGYLQGTNPLSIEAVTRRLAKILQLPLDLASLRSTSTKWEFKISNLVEQDEELAEEVRRLEELYDNELLELDEREL
jgi:proteasome assembly chaperone (PAC2) family protein